MPWLFCVSCNVLQEDESYCIVCGADPPPKRPRNDVRPEVPSTVVTVATMPRILTQNQIALGPDRAFVWSEFVRSLIRTVDANMPSVTRWRHVFCGHSTPCYMELEWWIPQVVSVQRPCSLFTCHHDSTDVLICTRNGQGFDSRSSEICHVLMKQHFSRLYKYLTYACSWLDNVWWTQGVWKQTCASVSAYTIYFFNELSSILDV